MTGISRLMALSLVMVALLLAAVVSHAQVCPPDVVWAEVVSEAILVHHDNAEFNCCPIMEYEITQVGWIIDIREIEVEPLCYCVCCFDLIHQLNDLDPGDYTVRVFGAYGCEVEPCGVAQFTVPDPATCGEGRTLRLAVETSMSGCGGWSLFADGFESGSTSAWSGS